jgi:hypothetical protein
MAFSLALLLFLAVADRPDVAGTVFVTVVAGLPSVLTFYVPSPHYDLQSCS